MKTLRKVSTFLGCLANLFLSLALVLFAGLVGYMVLSDSIKGMLVSPSDHRVATYVVLPIVMVLFLYSIYICSRQAVGFCWADGRKTINAWKSMFRPNQEEVR